MSDLDQLRLDLIASWGGKPAGELCLKLFERLAATPIGDLEMLTYPTLARILERPKVDHEVVIAVGILVTSSLHALEARALLIDDDQEYELDASQVAHAERTGELLHPESGELVEDFDSKLMPFFVPTTRFLKALRAERG